MCNLNDDCGDSSDELNCTNHFKCASSNQFLAHPQKCNGVIECEDYSDECNKECSKEIISGKMIFLNLTDRSFL